MELGWLFGEKNGQPLDNQHYVQDAPGGHKEPRKTKNAMKGRLRWFPKPVTVSRSSSVEVSGEGLRLTTDVQRLKLN